jgi:hypothetical protein
MNIQLVMAHPDDEVIFGWPILRKVSSILICSNDKNNPERAWCRYRFKALEEIGELLGIPVKSLNYDSEFYRLSARDGFLKQWMNEVLANVDQEADAIYTHNWMGEYGHLDHILVYQAMLKAKPYWLMTSDIHMESEWGGFTDVPVKSYPNSMSITKVKNDLVLYNQCKAIYDKYDVWTWSKDPVTECNLLMI